jgi:hypothetical protein
MGRSGGLCLSEASERERLIRQGLFDFACPCFASCAIVGDALASRVFN